VSRQPNAIPAALVSVLRQARRVTVLTGAGVSAESDVPTFRDAPGGLWASFKPEELATPEAFRQNPKRVWDWYEWRRQRIHTVHPNPGHDALAEMEKRVPEFTLVTQNVDGLHQRAGSRRVIELHGNITRTKCFDDGQVVEKWEDTGESPPRCPRCGGLLRPDVVWFGEMLPPEAIEEAERASRSCDVFFSVGTSTLVYPAASLPFAALRAGATVAEVNPQPTPLTDEATFSLSGPSGQVLPALLSAAWPAAAG
jgi:NAD-dependent deacetylase